MHAMKQQGDPGLKERERAPRNWTSLQIAKRAQRVSFHVAHSVIRGLNFELSHKEFDICMSF
jgi:hypothetical protein